MLTVRNKATGALVRLLGSSDGEPLRFGVVTPGHFRTLAVSIETDTFVEPGVGFSIAQATGDFSSWFSVSSAPFGTQDSFVAFDDGLLPDHPRTVYVRLTVPADATPADVAEHSTLLFTFTGTSSSAIAAPTGVGVTNADPGALIAWDAYPTASLFRVRRFNPDGVTSLGTTTDTSLPDESAGEGPYAYQVAALVGGTWGLWSDPEPFGIHVVTVEVPGEPTGGSTLWPEWASGEA